MLYIDNGRGKNLNLEKNSYKRIGGIKIILWDVHSIDIRKQIKQAKFNHTRINDAQISYYKNQYKKPLPS